MSKKYTIEELRELQPIIKSDEKRLAQNTLADLLAEKAKAQQDYNAAIEAADYEALAHAKTTENVIDDLITAQQAKIAAAEEEQKKREAAYSREDVKTSWEKYVAGFNSEFKARQDKYRAALKDVAAKYLELVELQRQGINDACHVNRLYSETAPVYDALACCDSDLTKPATLTGYKEQHKHYQSGKAYFYQAVSNPGENGFPNEYYKDTLLNVLIREDLIPSDKEQAIINVVDFGLPVSKPI